MIRAIEQCLHRKIAILEQLRANTATQGRFVQQQEMLGLNRVLQERQQLLDELAAVNQQLQQHGNWQTRTEIQSMAQTIQAMQQAILADSNQVIKEAMTEQQRVAAELRHIRAERSLENHYVKCWNPPQPGLRFNENK